MSTLHPCNRVAPSMTPDASLPPADVQRPAPPLTDEELAKCTALAERCPDSASPGHWDLAMHWVPRLIADLRASRAEVERLNRLRAVMVTAARERAAEVERLRGAAHYADANEVEGEL